jgi:hypothetical protein
MVKRHRHNNDPAPLLFLGLTAFGSVIATAFGSVIATASTSTTATVGGFRLGYRSRLDTAKKKKSASHQFTFSNKQRKIMSVSLCEPNRQFLSPSLLIKPTINKQSRAHYIVRFTTFLIRKRGEKIEKKALIPGAEAPRLNVYPHGIFGPPVRLKS